MTPLPDSQWSRPEEGEPPTQEPTPLQMALIRRLLVEGLDLMTGDPDNTSIDRVKFEAYKSRVTLLVMAYDQASTDAIASLMEQNKQLVNVIPGPMYQPWPALGIQTANAPEDWDMLQNALTPHNIVRIDANTVRVEANTVKPVDGAD